jgi:hypothetical protein
MRIVPTFLTDDPARLANLLTFAERLMHTIRIEWTASRPDRTGVVGVACGGAVA